MVKFILVTVMISCSLPLFAQNYIFGKVLSEDENIIGKVTVTNVKTYTQSVNNAGGEFMIQAEVGDEIRFTKAGYDRASVTVLKNDFGKNMQIILSRSAMPIEKVEIKYHVTGDLAKDAASFGERKKNTEAKIAVGRYIMQKSAPEVLLAKPGEFVQPVGPGFSVGAGAYKWDDVDFMNFLIGELGEDFFSNDLGLKKIEIQPFIYFVFRDFPRKKILQYGVVAQSDIAYFIIKSSEKVKLFKKPEPLPYVTN